MISADAADVAANHKEMLTVEKKSVLAELFVDEQSIIEQDLVEVLRPFVGLSSKTGEVVPKPAFTKLSQHLRILVALLAHLAVRRLGVADTPERVSIDWVAKQAQAPRKNVKARLSEMRKDHLVTGDNGQYEIAPTAVLLAIDRLRGALPNAGVKGNAPAEGVE